MVSPQIGGGVADAVAALVCGVEGAGVGAGFGVVAAELASEEAAV
jgi:hypothetical protein